MSKKSSKASILPLIVGALALLASVGIYFATRTVAHAFVLHLIAYLLTPLAVAGCLGWDSIAQRVGRRNDDYFTFNNSYSLILRILTALSFVVALPHIVAIAKDIAEKFAGQG
jgi:archaellum biogenesis protein FlaJ (TadC family)